MILDIILYCLIWEYVASLITAAIILRNIKLKEITVNEMHVWIHKNPKKALALSIINLPLLVPAIFFCLFLCLKTK